MFKKIIMIVILMGTLFSVKSQNKTDSSLCKKIIGDMDLDIGEAVGFTTGLGFSSRLWYKNFGFQATYLGQVRNNYSFQKWTGLSFLYMVERNKAVNFFVYESNLWYKDIRKIKTPDRFIMYEYLNFGGGIGLEFIVLEKLSFNFQGGFALYDDTWWDVSFSPTVELGLFYKFSFF